MHSESKHMLYDYVATGENIYNMERKIKKIMYFVTPTVKSKKKKKGTFLKDLQEFKQYYDCFIN